MPFARTARTGVSGAAMLVATLAASDSAVSADCTDSPPPAVATEPAWPEGGGGATAAVAASASAPSLGGDGGGGGGSRARARRRTAKSAVECGGTTSDAGDTSNGASYDCPHVHTAGPDAQ